MRDARFNVRGSAALGLASLSLLLSGPAAQAQQANYPLPKQPTAQSGTTNYYSVPLGFTWDHFAYQNGNHGDWNVGLGDSGFDAGEIPSNPQNCGVRGASCPATAGLEGPSFIHINNDPTHGFSNIPLLIGPTQDGYNNVQVAAGQSIPVVPGKYSAAFVSYTTICGPRKRMLTLNYTDSVETRVLTWADWCAPGQSPPDFFTWSPTHRLNPASNDNPTNGASCALITKYIPVDPNRTLTSITLAADQNSNGVTLPGDTITANCSRLVIGAITLASADPNLGGYGTVTGKVVNAAGQAQTTPEHDSTAAAGYEVFVVDPPLGNYGAGANIDGSFTLGLPAGTYTLSVAKRNGADDPRSAGPQGALVTVTVEAGKTTTQNITLADSPTAWGELAGTVKDAAGNPVAGAAILVSSSQNGPFAAVGIPQEDDGTLNETFGLTNAEGTFSIRGLATGKTLYVKAAGSGFASASAVPVTITPGGSTTQDISVVARPVGNIRGTIVVPGGGFGGIYVPVTLSSRDVTLTTTSRAEPPLAGTNRVPDDGSVTAVFEFESLPAGDYMLTLAPSSVQGAAASVPVTITAGQTATPTLTLAFPAWSEGTPDATKSDPLTGTSLDARWKSEDIGAPSAAGSVQPSANGLTVTANGAGWDTGADDSFHFVHQSVPNGDWVAYVTVTAPPASGMAGLMVSSADQANADRRANFAVSVRADAGIDAQGRVADGNITFPFGQTAPGTDPNNGGTQPPLPVRLKLRKVGAAIAGFYSADGGATQHFVGNLTPQFDPTGTLLLGMATTSAADGTTETATYRDFVFAPLTQPVTNPTGGQ